MLNLRSGFSAVALITAIGFTPAYPSDIFSGGLKDVGYAVLWNGPYFGIHGGYASSSLDLTDEQAWSGFRNTFGNNGSGAFGGGTWGWNWHAGHMVYGAEFDVGALDAGHTAYDPVRASISDRINAGVYGDVTARAGYVLGGTLLYAKGGFGFFNGDARVKDAAVADETFKTQSFTGWTLGGGIEYKLTPALSAKLEYLHFDFGNQEVQFRVNQGFRWDHAIALDTVKVGLNYEILDIRAPLK